MWERLKKAWSTQRAPARINAGAGEFNVYRVQLPDGLRDVLSLVPKDRVLESGLAPEAIIGMRASVAEILEPITAEDFRPNGPFVALLHDVIRLESTLHECLMERIMKSQHAQENRTG